MLDDISTIVIVNLIVKIQWSRKNAIQYNDKIISQPEYRWTFEVLKITMIKKAVWRRVVNLDLMNYDIGRLTLVTTLPLMTMKLQRN